MTTAMPADSLVEIVCTEGGLDGMRMGYAIRFNGYWEGWVLSLRPRAAVIAPAVFDTADAAVKWVVENWNKL